MTEPEIHDAFDQFLVMVKDPANASARPSLTHAAVAMAQTADSSEVMDSLDRLLSALQDDHDPQVLQVFLGGIEELAARVASSDVDQAIARLIAFNAEQPLVNDQVMNGLVQALDALPGEIETRELVELLKSPFCTGAARQSLLKMIETQTQLSFDGNPWNLVAMAKEAGIDPQLFRQPVQRPKGVVPKGPSSE
jgi:hypothetical protein